MDNAHILTAMASIGLAIIGVATLSVILSKNANTTGVLNALTGGFAQDLGTAESPVTQGNSGYASFTNFNSPSFGMEIN